MATAYQEHNRDVQQKSHHSVGEQDERSNFVDVAHVHNWHLNDKGYDAIHNGTDGREVVQRHKRVHFKFGRAEQAFDQGQPNGLEDDAARLIEEAGKNKCDLAISRDHDAHNDEGNVAEGSQVGRSNTKSPCG